MKNKKYLITAALLCISAFMLFLSGCGKKDDSSTAIAITPTPSDSTAAAMPSDSPTATPFVSSDGISANTNGTNTAFAASGNSMANVGMSGNSAQGSSKITGTIVAASMDDVTVRTSEGAEYTCSTTNAVNNLADGITLGNNITVTLASMSAVNGLYTATELNDLSSAQSNSQDTGILDGTGGNTLNEGVYDNDITTNDASQYSDGTIYDDGTAGTYTDPTDSGIYDDGTVYDDSSVGGSDYYYYDPSAEVYDDPYSY